MAEACAEQGYAQTSVAKVARRAGVSSVTFYKQFAGKDECLLAAHRQLLGRLLEELDRACDAESASEAKARVAIGTALALFAADPPSAQLLTIEIVAVGPEGVERHDAMVEAFARRLRSHGEPKGEAPVTSADWVRVAGTLALVGKFVASGKAARLPGLEDELVGTFSLHR